MAEEVQKPVFQVSQARFRDRVFARVAGQPSPKDEVAVFPDDKEFVMDPQVPFFAKMAGSRPMIRTYDLTNFDGEENIEDVACNTVNAVHERFGVWPALAYINGASLVLFYLRDENKQAHEWLDLGPFTVTTPIAPKSMKRMSIFGWAERYYHMFSSLDYYIQDEDDKQDGISFIRTDVFEKLCSHDEVADQQMFDRDDEGQIIKVKHRRVHMRLVTPSGLIKGDFILVDDLPWDVLTNEHNQCPELYSNDERFYAMAFIQHQCQVALTNVQLLNYFFGVFWHQENLLQSLNVDIEHHLLRVNEGDAPEHVLETLATEDDGLDEVDRTSDRETVISNSAPVIRAVNEKFEQYGVPKNISARLVQYAAFGAHMTLFPEISQDLSKRSLERVQNARRFVIPFAFVVSLTSQSAAAQAGVHVVLSPDEITVDPEIGLIVRDDEYDKIAEILGGGDQDDHVIVGLVRDSKTGELKVAGIRNPIGNQSDGKRSGVEYILKTPSPGLHQMLWDQEKRRYERIGRLDDFGHHLIPKYDPDTLPAVATDIDTSVGMDLDPKSHPVPDEYTLDFVYHKAAVAAKAAQVYGTHCLLSMAAYDAGKALSPVGPEGDVIDACTQFYIKQHVDALEQMNQRHIDELAGSCFDHGLYVRLPQAICSEKDVYFSFDGPLHQLMNNYDAVVKELFVPGAVDAVERCYTRAQRLVALYFDESTGAPRLFHMFNRQFQNYKRQVSGRNLSSVEFAQVCNNTVSQFLVEMGSLGKEEAQYQLQVDTFSYLVYMISRSFVDRSSQFRSMTKYSVPKRDQYGNVVYWSGADSVILNGAMTDYVLEAYRQLLGGV